MSRQGTRTDEIIIQAVSNSLKLTINIAESYETISPVAFVGPVNTEEGFANIYIVYIGELIMCPQNVHQEIIAQKITTLTG